MRGLARSGRVIATSGHSWAHRAPQWPQTLISGSVPAAAGADHIINYHQEEVAREIAKISPAGVDSIVEVAIAKNAAVDAEVLRNGGSISSYANDGGSEVTLGIRQLMTKNVRVQFVLVYTAPMQAKRHATDDITLALVTGAIRVGDEAGLPLHHYSLEQAGEAHAAVEQGAVGKVLIDVAGGELGG